MALSLVCTLVCPVIYSTRTSAIRVVVLRLICFLICIGMYCVALLIGYRNAANGINSSLELNSAGICSATCYT